MSFEQELHLSQEKSLLRLITCGSVDDGKSTLIGRLLYECDAIYDDQLQALLNDSKKVGTRGDQLDFALLVDGLSAEREQGITIDVAYRYFSTKQRKFIIADSPGHEQYTRNMVTAASTAQLAIVLVDATQGILPQTKRHTYLVTMMGIQQIVLAVNKMDLVGFSKERFDDIVRQYQESIRDLTKLEVQAIPLCAIDGDNLVKPSDRTAWHQGPSLLHHLESCPEPRSEVFNSPLRLPIQWVNRPNASFRGYTGTLASGRLNCGQMIQIMPSGQKTTIQSIAIGENEMSSATTGQAITITLQDHVDLSRGDVICQEGQAIGEADQFEAKIIWMSEDSLYPGRSFYLKLGYQLVSASITKIKHQIDMNHFEKQATTHLKLNAVAVCNLHVQRPILFEPYEVNHELGSFILIDKKTNHTVGAGLIDFPLHRSLSLTTQLFEINQTARAQLKNQQACVLWFTGMSGSGKSTIANLVETALHQSGHHTYILDGDNVRQGLNKDLGFTEADRIENVRRVAEVAQLMSDAGLIVLVTLISPFQKDRESARNLFPKDQFIEIHIDANLEELQKRDPKGLYQKVQAGQIKNFTGISSPYEKPQQPEIYIDTADLDAATAAQKILKFLEVFQGKK